MIGRLLVCGFLMCLASVGAAAAQPAPTSISPELEACIRDNAVGVERVIGDLSAAVDFLVTKRCAREESAERRAQYERQTAAMRAMWQQQCEQYRASGSNAPHDEEGQTYDPCTLASVYESTAASTTYVISGIGSANPEAISLAARLLLDRRIERRR